MEDAHDKPPRAFRLTVKPGGPSFRLLVLMLAGGTPAKEDSAGEIEVASCRDGKRLQQFRVESWQPIDFGNSLQAQDINFDGLLDFSVLVEFAGGWVNRAHWIYDPHSGLFVKNALTHALEVEWKGSVFDFDPEKHEIGVGHLGAFTACPAEPDRYLIRDNRPILAYHVDIESDGKTSNCTEKIWKLVGGMLRVAEQRTVDQQGNRVK